MGCISWDWRVGGCENGKTTLARVSLNPKELQEVQNFLKP